MPTKATFQRSPKMMHVANREQNSQGKGYQHASKGCVNGQFLNQFRYTKFHFHHWSLWASGWRTVPFFQYFQTAQPIPANRFSQKGAGPKNKPENACRSHCGRNEKTKGCPDQDGDKALDREYFFGMKDWGLKLVCSWHVGTRGWSMKELSKVTKYNRLTTCTK